MSAVSTLYSICFNYIKDHTEDIVSLDGIPFKPVVENLIHYLVTSDVPLNSSILSVISHSHSKSLRSANLRWTQLNFDGKINSIYPLLKAISFKFPKFITHLKIGKTDLEDNDIFLLSNFTNLKVLDFQKNQNITDRTVSYITTMSLNTSNGRGLPYLEELYFDHVRGITDKSLKFFAKMTGLCYLSLSGTQVTKEVAETYLTSHGYRISPPRPQDDIIGRFPDMKMHSFIELLPDDFVYTGIRTKHVRSTFDTHHTPLLEFKRDLTRPILKKEPSKAPEKRPIKRQRLIATDFLAMVESELANDSRD
ncbi:hypothetical protein INT48_009504 [Thamnidium elegans]|uniref:Uncharacterized protein n=1 Tax=Thamnidium elegans TaxID=101142 RepID=A0A8H7SZX3_9FUNG|nr:hypothetical protein INT48_009504 [Thamnidium elegans]